MNDVDQHVAESFGRLFPVPAVAADWDDVLHKAGTARPSRSRTVPRRRVVALAAAALLVALGTASAFAIAREVLFNPAGRVSRTVEDVRFSFSVPRGGGWMNGPLDRVRIDPAPVFRSRDLYISKSLEEGQAAEVVVLWTGFRDRTEAWPCNKLPGGQLVDGSAREIAAAVARTPGTTLVKGPAQVTVGERPAQHVVLKVRRAVRCPGFFFTWRDERWGDFWPGTGVGDTISMWIVDVRGTRVAIEAAMKEPDAGAPAEIRATFKKADQEIAAIIKSIRFG